MDDIRRPSQRRDYSLPRSNYAPPANPSAPSPESDTSPAPSSSLSRVTLERALGELGEGTAQLAQTPHEASFTPVIPAEPAYAPALPQEVTRTPYQPPAPQPQPEAQPKPKIVHFFPYKYVAAAVAVLLVLGAAGYFIAKPAKKSGYTVDELAKKSTFSFYYPQPMPGGYSYVIEQNAIQDGQAYFMIGRGNKHMVFREQASAGGGLNNTPLSKPQTIQTPAGKAVVGTVAGQPAAKVVAGSTLISVNTTGGVSQDEVTAAVKSLKSKE